MSMDNDEKGLLDIGGNISMYPNELYKIGKKLGMNKKDINNVLTTESTNIKVVEVTSPIESYKGMPGRYGTFSIKDMQ